MSLKKRRQKKSTEQKQEEKHDTREFDSWAQLHPPDSTVIREPSVFYNDVFWPIKCRGPSKIPGWIIPPRKSKRCCFAAKLPWDTTDRSPEIQLPAWLLKEMGKKRTAVILNTNQEDPSIDMLKYEAPTLARIRETQHSPVHRKISISCYTFLAESFLSLCRFTFSCCNQNLTNVWE